MGTARSSGLPLTSTSRKCWQAKGSRRPRMRRSRRWRSPRARLRWPIGTGIAAKALICATPRTARCCSPATAVTRRAAEATSGRMLLHQGQPALVFYSAWCGGHSELASQVWPGAIDYAYEPSLEDDACEGEPAWTSEIKAGDLERALRAAGLRGSRLRDLRSRSRGTSRIALRGIRVDGLHPVRDQRPRVPHGGRPHRGMAGAEEHGVRSRADQQRLSISRPRLRSRRRTCA